VSSRLLAELQELVSQEREVDVKPSWWHTEISDTNGKMLMRIISILFSGIAIGLTLARIMFVN
jgi:tetrahydromethanopterin S-methyltransferase subunit G